MSLCVFVCIYKYIYVQLYAIRVTEGEKKTPCFHIKQTVQLLSDGPPPSFNEASSQQQPDTSQRKSFARPDTTI